MATTIELIPADSLSDHELVHNNDVKVITYNVAQQGRMVAFSDKKYANFYFSPLFRHKNTMKIAKTQSTLLKIVDELDRLHSDLLEKLSKLETKTVNSDIANEYNEKMKNTMIQLEGYDLHEEQNSRLMKYIKETFNISFDSVVLKKYSYGLENSNQFLARMQRIQKIISHVIPKDSVSFACLQEVEINNDNKKALENLVDINRFGSVLPPFGDLNQSDTVSCAVTIYDKSNYEVLSDNTNTEISSIYEKLNPLTLNSDAGKNNKLNICAFRHKTNKYYIFVVNVHADFVVMNNPDILVKFFKTVDELFNTFKDKLCIAGDFNIMKKVYDQYINEKEYPNMLVQKVLTPELGEDIQQDCDRTYDIIFYYNQQKNK